LIFLRWSFEHFFLNLKLLSPLQQSVGTQIHISRFFLFTEALPCGVWCICAESRMQILRLSSNYAIYYSRWDQILACHEDGLKIR
jgi:hypothetical protein